MPPFFKRLIIYSIILVLLIASWLLLLEREKSLGRDMIRLAEIRQLEATFELLYVNHASYALAAQDGCATKDDLVSQCNLSAYLPEIASLKDPGKFAYTVTEPPSASGYKITFTLEGARGDLAKGEHTLSAAGLK